MDAAPPALSEEKPPTDQRAPSSSHAVIRVFDGLLAVAVLALAFLLASFTARNTDLWGNLAVGRLVTAGQYPFGTDPFSALNPAPVWINPAWLFGVVTYSLHQVAGGAALVVVKAVLVALLAALLLAIHRPGRGLWLPAVSTTIALLTMTPRLLLQPPVMSFFFLGLLLFLLHRGSQRSRRWQFPVAIGVLFLLWANLDGGFVFGLASLALWLLGHVLQQFFPLGDRAAIADPSNSDFGFQTSDLGLALVVAIAACVANPFHVRVFQLPNEFAAWSLPEQVQGDAYFRQYFLKPFDRAYAETPSVGLAPAIAYYMLLGLGLGSFVANVGGWRWERALVWVAFAWLSTQSNRLVPYFAVVAGPVLVLNLQAFASRRWPTGTALNARAAFTRAYLAGAGRFLTFLVIVGLGVLAWPGWLAGDAGRPMPQRRVAWRIEPDPTMERIARQLATLYDSGLLRSDEERGFHLQPEFVLICAWFCPQEKGLIDPRLTAPPAVAADFAQLRKAILDLPFRAARTDEPTGPPADVVLRKMGITHLVLTGVPMRPAFLAQALWRDPDQFPFWALAGRGLVFGWNDPERPASAARAGLRLEPLALAFGPGAQTVPSATEVFEAQRPTPWERFAHGSAPVPVDAFEAGLWLSYRDVQPQRAEMAALAWQEAARLGNRFAQAEGVPALVQQIAELTPPVQVAPQVARNVVFRLLPGMEALDAAPLLAVRAARRGILANSEDYESYLRLGQAYAVLPTDRDLGRMQQIAALRAAVQRLPAANRGVASDAFNAYQQLFSIYVTLSGPSRTADAAPDLALEALEKMVELFPRAVAEDATMPPDQAQAQLKSMSERLQALRESVKRRSDTFITATTRAQPIESFRQAYGRGLVREALNVLRSADAPTMGVGELLQRLDLELLVGNVSEARELLLAKELSLDRLPPQIQPQFRRLQIMTAAAVGDYDWADGELTTAEGQMQRAVESMIPGQLDFIVRLLIFPDLTGAPPLARSCTFPVWGGAVQQVAEVQLEQGRLHLWHGLLALEAGNIALARREMPAARLYELAQVYGRYLK